MEEVKRISRELIHHGVVVDFYADTVCFSNGHTAVWDYIHHGGAAAVVPVMEDGTILMVRQYRNALDRFTLEIPAGKLDSPGEDMALCAARELEEETGYRAGKLEELLTLNTTVAICDEKIGIFLATELTPSVQHLDDDEEINVERCTLEELLQEIYAQKICDSKTVAGILAYACRAGRTGRGADS